MTTPLLRAARTSRHVTLEELSNGGDVLLLAPHPGDESLGCGGAIAAMTDAGRRVQVVVVTDGGHSHPASRNHPPDRLREIRADEVRAAVDILTGRRGPDPLMLGYPDNGAPEGDPIDEAIATILPCITLITWAVWCTWGGDPHADHARCARLASRLVAEHGGLILWSYPIWGRFDDTEPGFAPDTLAQFETHAWQDRKAAAIAAHSSQMSGLVQDDPARFRMTDAHQRHFIDTPEIFLRERG